MPHNHHSPLEGESKKSSRRRRLIRWGDSEAPTIGAIAAMTQDRVIGLDGAIPWHYPEDLKRFKSVTMGSAIIMGRLTWESIHCRALPGRRNIVISRAPVQAVEHYDRIQLALAACADRDIWVIGGGQIYQAALKWLTRLDITYVPDRIDRPDAVRFPFIDPRIWQVTQTTRASGSELTHVTYHRKPD